MLNVVCHRTCRLNWRSWLLLGLVVPIGSALHSTHLTGQTAIPPDQFHLSVTLGGHFLVGLGYTNWVEEHHALEFTLFPFAHPKEGFPFGIRAGYAWVPSDEIWRAKLGANVTLLFRAREGPGDRFTPTVGLTPGIVYSPDSGKSFRGDFWMSYYLRERAFVPTGLEFLYNWNR